MNVKGIMTAIKDAAVEKSPELLVALGIGSGVAAIILAAKVGSKAKAKMDNINKEYGDKLTKEKAVAIAKNVAPLYIPAIVAETASVACICGGMHIKTERNVALATTLAVSEQLARDYSEKVIETIGEKKEAAIRSEVAKEQLERNPLTTELLMGVEGEGDTLFYDPWSGRYFKNDIEKMRRIAATLSRRLDREMDVPLNELYYEIGLSNTEAGNVLCFCVEDGDIEFKFDAQKARNEQPCLVVGYNVGPRYRYDGTRYQSAFFTTTIMERIHYNILKGDY